MARPSSSSVLLSARCAEPSSRKIFNDGEGLTIVPYRFDGSIFKVAIVAHLVLLSSRLCKVIILRDVFLFGPRAYYVVAVPEPAGQNFVRADNATSNMADWIKEL
ncbi:hypothetical protein [Bradyrhizobium sp. 146]|uniref:hypothetical protein n=1 Tax=Bradyrhizobium sp. 146 TaxID=2782622 RepID=UPI001FFAC711|nr:hypothetical protein [Bradyrhizobium sp. 146]